MNANPERGGPQTARNEARGRRNGRPSAGRAVHRHSRRRASHFLFLTHGSPVFPHSWRTAFLREPPLRGLPCFPLV